MIALLCFVLNVFISPFKSKSRLEGENGRGQSKPDGLGILAVIIIIDGAIQFFDLEDDFEVVAMNADPLNGAPNQFKCVCAPDAGREVGGLTVSRLLSTRRLDDNSLHFIGTDAWS